MHLLEGVYVSDEDERNVLGVEDFNTLYNLISGDVEDRISIFGINYSETRVAHDKICEILKALSSNSSIMFSFIYMKLTSITQN